MLAIDENNVLRYVDEYVDIMENISNQVQPLISEIRRLDIIYFDIINQLDMCKKMLASATTPRARSNIFDQVQHLLHFGQINGDRKIECLRELLASFEAKNMRLDQHVSILEPPPLPNPQTRLTQASSSARRPSIGGTKHSMTDKSSHNNHLESQPINRDGRTPTTSNDTTRLNGRLKRPRKPKPVDLDESPHQHLDISTISTLKSIGESSGSNNDANNGSEKSNGEKKRRASVRACKPTNKKRAGGRNVHVPVDPDEPTYCHCGQVSFGDMIGCDYGKCAIEWFHFECVELKSKPKGKWYCPECRGDKMNVLKASLAK